MISPKILKSFAGMALLGQVNSNTIVSVNSVYRDREQEHSLIGFCEICRQPFGEITITDINCSDLIIMNEGSLEEVLDKIHSITQRKTHHIICKKCYVNSKELLESINRIPLEEIPMHINDYNFFAANRAKERLKGL